MNSKKRHKQTEGFRSLDICASLSDLKLDKNPKARKLIQGYTIFCKNILYKNIEAGICKAYKNSSRNIRGSNQGRLSC